MLSDEYSDKLDKKLRETCERVLHSTNQETDVAFHVDYVPIKYAQMGRHAARRSTNEWFSSDTKQLVEWFHNIAVEQVFLSAIILILKRMRDTADLTHTLSSICITALACRFYKNKSSYAADLLNIVDGIIDLFDVPHSELMIRIEPLVDDLADKIDATQQETILSFFKEAKRLLLEGFTNEDLMKLRNVLSSSFPARIADFPEYLEPLRRRGWGIETDGSLRKIFITEHEAKGTVMSRRWRKFIGTGERLEFRATPYDRQEYGIRWQVLNAADSPQVRGELFEAHTIGGHKNSNEFINHETEEYNGTHWIRYYVYSKRSKRVVEIGERFFVEVNN